MPTAITVPDGPVAARALTRANAGGALDRNMGRVLECSDTLLFTLTPPLGLSSRS